MVIDSSLSWGPHVEYTVTNASKKLWLLIRFKNLGASREQLITLFQLKIRCLAEFAAPAFNGALTKQQSADLEMIQKKAFGVILGSEYKSYSNALSVLSQDTLSSRRQLLSTNFALKCTKHPKHMDLFTPNPRYKVNQKSKKKYLEPLCKKTRYYKSAIPYLTRLLNTVV